MRTKTLPVLMATAMALPCIAQAEPTVYGSIRIAMVDADNGSDLEMRDEVSRIGIKGNVDLGIEGTKGFYRFEIRLRADTGEFGGESEKNARLSYIGAKGKWGKAQIGRMWMTHSLWTNMIADGGFHSPFFFGGNNVTFRMPKAVTYISPKYQGFQVAATSINGGSMGRIGETLDNANASGNHEDIDARSFTARYMNGGLTLGAAHTSTSIDELEGDYEINTLAAQYKVDGFKFQALMTDEENKTGLGRLEEYSSNILAVQYQMAGGTGFRVKYDDQEYNGFDSSAIMYGVSHKMGKGQVWAEYADVDVEAPNQSTKYGIYPWDFLNVGYRIDF